MALKEPATRDQSKIPSISPKELVYVLRDCRRCRDLLRGRQAHAKAIELGLCSDSQVANSLISMYAKCGSMADACKVFDELPAPGVVSWTCLIQGYVENGRSEAGLEAFERMVKLRCAPDARTYVAAISACADLGAQQRGAKWIAKGKELHSQALANRCCNVFVESVLLKMYASFGSMSDARSVFEGMSRRDVVSWTCLLQGYVGNGQCEVALEMFERMRLEKLQPDSRTYVIALMACSALGAQQAERRVAWLERGKAVYSEAARSKCCNIFVENAAIVMYSKCRSMREARGVFEGMIQRDVVSFTSMLQGYVENDEHELALEFFEEIDAPDARCFASAISACASLSSDRVWLERGKDIHLRALKSSCCDIFVENAVLSLFAQSGSMADARNIFDSMQRRDVVSWTTLVQGYASNGESEVALQLYDAMRGVCESDARTYVAAITACASLAAASDTRSKREKWLARGEAIHVQALESDCCNTFVENNLVEMYVKCGNVERAREVFDGMKRRDEISWTCLMQGYVDSGDCELALQVFERMSDRLADGRAYVVALGACASLRSRSSDRKWLEAGKQIHSRALRSGRCDAFVENALIGMYSKRGETLGDASRVFESMVELSVVSWTALITGYVDTGENELALLATDNAEANIILDPALLVVTLKACTGLMALETGKKLHSLVERHGVESRSVATCLVELYGKCGSTELAQIVFDSHASPDVYMWNSLLCGYSQQGAKLHSFQVFDEMKRRSFRPNEFTFTHILAVCSHAGLTEKGKALFDSMASEYEVAPNLVHYNCLVDLLGRANKIEKAMEVVREMEFEADVVTWTTLLSACAKWNDVKLGEVVYEKLVKLGEEQHLVINYVLMANLKTRGSRKHERTPGTTLWTDECRKVHVFN